MKAYEETNIKICVPNFSEAAGFYTNAKRSCQMSKIRSRNSKPELILRRALWARNIRFRLHDKSLSGTPDIVIKKYKLAIFVDGEFWHGFDWCIFRTILHHHSAPKYTSDSAVKYTTLV